MPILGFIMLHLRRSARTAAARPGVGERHAAAASSSEQLSSRLLRARRVKRDPPCADGVRSTGASPTARPPVGAAAVALRHAKEERAMERIREQRKVRILRIAPGPVLPLDPRDPEVVRVKAMRRHPSYVAKQRGPR
jgi:hypothetical protein